MIPLMNITSPLDFTSFKGRARAVLLGCDIDDDIVSKLLVDCEASIRQEDAFGFMKDAERAGEKYGLRYTTFEDFHLSPMQLQLSIALRGQRQ